MSEALSRLLQARTKRILDYAELAVPSDKFERFRTLILNEMGQSGLQRDLAELIGGGMDRQGKGRTQSGEKGSVP